MGKQHNTARSSILNYREYVAEGKRLKNTQRVYQYIDENGPCSATMIEVGTGLKCNVVSSSIHRLREKYSLVEHYSEELLPCKINRRLKFYHVVKRGNSGQLVCFPEAINPICDTEYQMMSNA